MLQEVLRLPFSTADCDIGPVVEHRPGHVTLRYDAEARFGPGIVWTVLAFRMVVAIRFTPDAACSAWMIEADTRVCEVDESEWLENLAANASASRQAVSASARHFVIYFDHIGCWEVLADEVALET